MRWWSTPTGAPTTRRCGSPCWGGKNKSKAQRRPKGAQAEKRGGARPQGGPDPHRRGETPQGETKGAAQRGTNPQKGTPAPPPPVYPPKGPAHPPGARGP